MLQLRFAIPVLLPLLMACGNPGGLTLHNSLPDALQISGLPSGNLELLTDQRHHIGGVDSSLSLQAIGPSGSHAATIPAPPPGGEALWAIGGGACFVLGDYSSYYEAPLDVPAAIVVMEFVGKEGEPWISSGAIATPPGQRLPAKMRGGRALAIVQVPCEVTASKDVARGWLEMTLDDLQPSRGAQSQ
jgi:hypothetical protein